MAVRPIDAVQVLNDINWHHKPTPVSEFESGFNQGINQAMWIITHAPTLTPPNEWVSVEERLPEYNPGTGAKSYWVAKKDSAGNWQMKIAQYCDYGYAMTVDAETEITWRDWDFTKIVSVTHWMPLPAPPNNRPPEGEEDNND